MLPVQEYLLTHSFADLIADHGVYASLSKNKKYASFNYDAIDTGENDQLAWDCRGLILCRRDYEDFPAVDSKVDLTAVLGTTTVLCMGFRRFFNEGQQVAFVNWKDPQLVVQDKMDGTLILCWYHPYDGGHWNVATRSVPEANLLMDNGIFTFRTLFEKSVLDTCGFSFDQLANSLDKTCTYCFELCTPYNRIVVAYPENRITLLGCRDLISGNELDIKALALPKEIPLIEEYQVPSSTEKLIEWVASRSPMEYEGVVVRDSKFNRVKIKSPQYLALHRVSSSLSNSERNCLELILSERDDDYASALPPVIYDNLQRIKRGLHDAMKAHDLVFTTLSTVCNHTKPGDKKTFALALNTTAEKERGIWTAPLFQMYAGKCQDMRSFIALNRKEGTWSHSFLDKLLKMSGHYQTEPQGIQLSTTATRRW